jgi:hypothetical protein
LAHGERLATALTGDPADTYSRAEAAHEARVDRKMLTLAGPAGAR